MDSMKKLEKFSIGAVEPFAYSTVSTKKRCWMMSSRFLTRLHETFEKKCSASDSVQRPGSKTNGSAFCASRTEKRKVRETR